MFGKVEGYMEHASHRTAVGIKSNVSILKESLIRGILSGEPPTEKEQGYLKAIEDVEKIIQGYIDGMKEDN